VLKNVKTISRAKSSATTDHTCHAVLAAWISDQQYVCFTLDRWQHKWHFVSYSNSIHLIRKSMVEVTRFTFTENYQKHYNCKQKLLTLRTSHYNYFTTVSPELDIAPFSNFHFVSSVLISFHKLVL